MKKSIIIFVTSIALSAGMVIYGWAFVDSRVGEVSLTEETMAGNKAAADGLTVGFRADSADNLHWISSYDYNTDKTDSSFKRGEMTETIDASVYDDIRFTGWSTVPFSTRLKCDRLEGLQEKKIQAFYNRIQHRVMETGAEEEGRIRLCDYLDYYPVSFRFQFGTKTFNSDSALTGLKVYDERNMLSPENISAYDDQLDLYEAFNNMFKIPVIENEYQEYKVSKIENYDYKTSLGYNTDIEKPLGKGKDFYEFDPIITIQEENIMDGKKWVHPDLSGGSSYEVGVGSEKGSQSDEAYVRRKASEYDLKNRMLFIVNNRTAKGVPVDVSQMAGGYGVYELPIEVTATATVKRGRRSSILPSPKPLSDELAMVYPLDEEAEYVEMSLSEDHRYLAVFSVKDGSYFVDLIDADSWASRGPVEVFPAAEKMAYAWGEDGSLAVTNHSGYIAVFTRTGDESRPYEVLYSGKAPDDLDKAFFGGETVTKKNTYARYKYGIEKGLAIAAKGGKVALVQNLLVGDPQLNMRTAALECAIIDKSGVIYRGRLKNNVVDLEYHMSREEIQAIRYLSGGAVMKLTIEPVINENWCKWESANGA